MPVSEGPEQSYSYEQGPMISAINIIINDHLRTCLENLERLLKGRRSTGFVTFPTLNPKPYTLNSQPLGDLGFRELFSVFCDLGTRGVGVAGGRVFLTRKA